jgi:hypothetical protein
MLILLVLFHILLKPYHTNNIHIDILLKIGRFWLILVAVQQTGAFERLGEGQKSP